MIRHNVGVGSSLTAVIEEEIDRRGSITFARYMELALYYPQLGYYRREKGEVFGTRGDFYTSGQLQPVWGELLSSFVGQLHHASGASAQFGVLDLGAGQQDLRTALDRWNYRAFDWDTGAIPETFSGLVLANEFFDALPVHLVRRREAGWHEVVVKAIDGQFAFAELDEVSPAVLKYAECYGHQIPEGGLLEVCLTAAEWIARIGRLLTSGDVLVIDYGYESRELARFSEGTLLAYRKHAATGDLLSSPGTGDITAHVNFSYLRDLALDAGLEIIGESLLAGWALHVWDEQELGKRWKMADERWRLQWKQLMFGMGPTFSVLHLRKQTYG